METATKSLETNFEELPNPVGSAAIGSEAAWDLWVEEICAAVLKCSVGGEKIPVSFEAYLRSCLQND
jgi:hypothetical protein